MYRIGNGIDFHRMEKLNDEQWMTLGGLKIKSIYKIIAHSDGDIILHALSDAILGACGEADIGFFFPNDKEENKHLDSKLILHHALNIMKQKQYTIENIDLTIVSEEPKINPLRDEMKKKIAELCNITLEQISIKATTTETMGFIGRKEGIACFATVLLKKNQSK